MQLGPHLKGAWTRPQRGVPLSPPSSATAPMTDAPLNTSPVSLRPPVEKPAATCVARSSWRESPTFRFLRLFRPASFSPAAPAYLRRDTPPSLTQAGVTAALCDELKTTHHARRRSSVHRAGIGYLQIQEPPAKCPI